MMAHILPTLPTNQTEEWVSCQEHAGKRPLANSVSTTRTWERFPLFSPSTRSRRFDPLPSLLRDPSLSTQYQTEFNLDNKIMSNTTPIARCPAFACVSPAVATEAGISAFNSPLENCLLCGPSIPELSPPYLWGWERGFLSSHSVNYILTVPTATSKRWGWLG